MAGKKRKGERNDKSAMLNAIKSGMSRKRENTGNLYTIPPAFGDRGRSLVKKKREKGEIASGIEHLGTELEPRKKKRNRMTIVHFIGKADRKKRVRGAFRLKTLRRRRETERRALGAEGLKKKKRLSATNDRLTTGIPLSSFRKIASIGVQAMQNEYDFACRKWGA